ncbi:ornithine cyclodeaminase family protein [Sphingomonas sp. YL-JM2C]
MEGPVFVSAEVVRQVFNWREAIGALQRTYAHDLPPAAVPSRSIAQDGDVWLRLLPAAPPGGRYFGAKLMGAAMSVPQRGVEYVIVLFDRRISRIAAFVDANLLTGYRTAATSAAALDRLAPAQPARLAVIGSGLEATMHVRAFASIRSLSEVTVFSPTPERRQTFAQKVEADLAVRGIVASSVQEAVADADIILCAARSRGEEPLLFGDWVKPGTTIVSIGSTVPSQREIDHSVAAVADLIVCDMREEVLEQTGDMIAARQAGIDVEGKSFSLTELMSGALDRKLAETSIPMFKSVGGGLQDIVIAEMALERALAAGLATALPMNFENKSF